MLWGLAELTSCADYLPPRKNCLSRGYDKLKQIAKEASLKPTPAPIPINNILAYSRV